MTSAENTNVQQVVVADDSEDGITLMDLMRIIRKHLVTATIVFVMVFAGVTAYTFLVPPKYTATAQAMATYNASQGMMRALASSTRVHVHRWPDHVVYNVGNHRNRT